MGQKKQDNRLFLHILLLWLVTIKGILRKGSKNMKAMKSALVTILAITLCSCRISPYTLANKQTDGISQQITLTVVLHEDEDQFLEAALQAYRGSRPSIQTEIVRLPNDGSYNSEVLAKQHSDQPPTAFVINGERDLKLWQEDAILLPFEWLDNAPDSLTDPVRQNGGLRALPINLVGYGLLYNSELLSSLEVDSSSLNTWEGLQQVVQALNEQSAQPDSSLKAAFCPTADFSPFTPVGENRTTLQLRTLSGLQGVLGLLPTPEVQDTAQLLASGEAALAVGSTELLRNVREISAERANALRIAPLPLDGQAASSITVGCSYLVVSRTAGQAEQNAMLDFLNWLYNSPEGQEVLSSYGVVSPYSDTSSSALQSSLYSYIRTERVSYSAKGSFPSGWAEECDAILRQYRSGALVWEDTIGLIEENWNKKVRD
ncbi:ABC transporter, solute-binding protein [[Clostridium] methylpentosum DSM 5476]|uniref:ABC transporter, solute-binding protein n=1 Tax=[Clostridium] methylpentosum DSM 5476 TaxID=537013 RepID=C0E8V9_9FIRM|nr:ABC transporter, solute-binding protein [[Clostridium] methylpentosum DSM 5476]